MPSYFAYRIPHSQECKTYEISRTTEDAELKIVSFEGTPHHFSIDQEIKLDEVITVLQPSPLKSTSKEAYKHSFEDCQRLLNEGTLHKVVLSKLKIVDGNFYPINLLQQLNRLYENTFNYLLIDPEIGCWIGATPETLGTFAQNKFNTMSLAGTISESEEWSDKEKEEQAVVTQFIQTKLEDISTLVHVGEVEEIKAGSVRHLKTDLAAELTRVSEAQQLLTALHPTPATCGLPQNKAKEIILKTETHNRELYTGYISIQDPTSIQAYVNLRCMQLFKDSAVLYLGGGLTAKSDLEKEWQETERKAETLLKVLK